MRYLVVSAIIFAAVLSFAEAPPKTSDDALGTQPYDRYEKPEVCGECHSETAMQYEQAMMSQAFTHIWDEVEYFELALPHSLKEPKVAGVKAGCNGCHAPLAFLAGDIPPKRPSENTRANESVSCDLCHTLTGFSGDTPYNFNFIAAPGSVKQGPRGAESPYHGSKENQFFRSAELCGTCHNEKDPWGVFVKSTHLEWKQGPYGKAGIVCQDCHMPKAQGSRQHLFHGAHDEGKLSGSVEVRINPLEKKFKAGQTARLSAVVMNAKAGHSVPSGSSEERMLWLHVEAVDSAGRVFHLLVDKKNTKDEAYAIASDSALAYQDIGDIRGLKDFKGLARDGRYPHLGNGDRIYRLPFLDPKGRMTIAQWNTASQAEDYRLKPLEGVVETFSWKLPPEIAPGPVRVSAEVYYSRVVSSVAEYFKLPAEEYEEVRIGGHETTFIAEK